ncbi:MAG TPA: hypothetical protein VJB66_04910 [Candidatus Nanoarchaeia archaeon]|nr:hypothetical protein [Candidatus Nanoarchaeia archaeon]
MNTAQKLRRILDTHPHAVEYARSKEHDIGELLCEVERMQDFSAEEFDRRIMRVYAQEGLKAILEYTNPETIYSELGTDALLWLWSNGNSRHADSLERYTGWKMSDINASWESLGKQKKFDALSQLKMRLELVRQARLFNTGVDLYTPEMQILPERRRRDYDVKILRQKEEKAEDVKTGTLYEHVMGGFLGLGLTYKNHLEALVAFEPKNKNRIFIPQIQGVTERNDKGDVIRRPEGLYAVRWKHNLITLIEAIACSAGFKESEIQSAKNNRWLAPDHEGGMSIDHAVKIYDKTAQELNYKPQTSGNWIKKLTCSKTGYGLIRNAEHF